MIQIVEKDRIDVKGNIPVKEFAMQFTPSHKALARRFIMSNTYKHDFLPDSLLKLVAFAYSEEEAGIVTALGTMPKPAMAIAKKVNRPVHEVAPILESLSARCLIGSTTNAKGVKRYNFLPLAPGVFEMVMIHSRGTHDHYYKEFARLFEEFYNECCEWIRPYIYKKDLRFGRIIPIERAIEKTQGLGVIALPTDYYSEIVDRNKKFCLVSVCPCRHMADLNGTWCGRPKDVCSAMGLAADMLIEKGLGRQVSKQEFLDAKARAWEAGLVNMVDNLHDPCQICSCCTCCCGALRILKQHNIPTLIVQSHFEAHVNSEKCLGCSTCVNICPMDAITLGEDNKARIDYIRCIGCGHCVSRCDNGAMALRERRGYKPPAETMLDYAANRFLEIKGLENVPYLPQLTLGIGRLLNRFGPHKVSGPRYPYKHLK